MFLLSSQRCRELLRMKSVVRKRIAVSFEKPPNRVCSLPNVSLASSLRARLPRDNESKYLRRAWFHPTGSRQRDEWLEKKYKSDMKYTEMGSSFNSHKAQKQAEIEIPCFALSRRWCSVVCCLFQELNKTCSTPHHRCCSLEGASLTHNKTNPTWNVQGGTTWASQRQSACDGDDCCWLWCWSDLLRCLRKSSIKSLPRMSTCT